MKSKTQPLVAIIDYGRGNIFSVKNASEKAGFSAVITNSPESVMEADAVILPGVGAFGDAMETLKHHKLDSAIKNSVQLGKPFLGICLGMQLLMTESFEFGHHRGLDIIKGSVVKFDNICDKNSRRIKVPHIGWNCIYSNKHTDTWKDTLLSGLEDNDFMYFNHSFYVKPKDDGIIVSLTEYGGIKFCSALRLQNIHACQFHPERSGMIGLEIYRNFFKFLDKSKVKNER